jgi:galactose mutarotase-like enzyme
MSQRLTPETTPNMSQEAVLGTANGSEVRVSTLGALFTLDLHSVPVLIPVTRGDGKSIKTHFCTPNFGKDHSGIFSLKQHGNMRNEPCEVTAYNSRIVIHHKITDSPHMYPAGVSVTVTITLENGACIFTITHKNTGKLPAPVNCGVHCYFNAPESYIGTTINGLDISDLVEQTGNIEFKDSNSIVIPALPALELQQSGFSKAVLWVGENEKGVKDAKYVCIEPVEFLPEEFNKPHTLIQPNTSRTSKFSLNIGK